MGIMGYWVFDSCATNTEFSDIVYSTREQAADAAIKYLHESQLVQGIEQDSELRWLLLEGNDIYLVEEAYSSPMLELRYRIVGIRYDMSALWPLWSAMAVGLSAFIYKPAVMALASWYFNSVNGPLWPLIDYTEPL